MKKIIVFFAVLCLPLAMTAQETVDNSQIEEGNHKPQTSNLKPQIPSAVYLELLGGSTMAGINYDQRFNDHTRWGFRAGFSFAYSTAGGFLSANSDSRYWAVPIGINYLIGSKKNNLELGLGASLGIVNSHGTVWSAYTDEISQEQFDRYMDDSSLLPANSALFQNSDDKKCFLTTWDAKNEKANQFGYYFFGDIGYRHVANSGFLFRAGLSPSFNFGGKHAICRTFGDTFRKFSLGFYLGFGWAF